MSFFVGTQQKNGLDFCILRDEISQTEIEIVSSCGACLHSFAIAVDAIQFNIIDNYHDLKEIKDQMALSYKSAKLSPFPCRINKGKYNFQGKEYEFNNK